jgi:hypothetical protein
VATARHAAKVSGGARGDAAASIRT